VLIQLYLVATEESVTREKLTLHPDVISAKNRWLEFRTRPLRNCVGSIEAKKELGVHTVDKYAQTALERS
jgi:hypothetical protein